MITDARYRFERGIDPSFTESGLDYYTQLALNLFGGEPSDLIIAGSNFIFSHINENYGEYLSKEKKLRVIFRGINVDYFNPKNITYRTTKGWTDQTYVNQILPFLKYNVIDSTIVFLPSLSSAVPPLTFLQLAEAVSVDQSSDILPLESVPEAVIL